MILNKEPDQLIEILKDFENKCTPDDLEKIFQHIDIYDKNRSNGELSINQNYKINLKKGNSNVHNTYLGFMALCLYYSDKNLTNAAWYYFSRAEYFKGIRDSWDKVSEEKENIENLKREKEEQKRRKELNALDLIISKALQDRILNSNEEEKKYWTDKSHFINGTISEVFEIMNKYKKSRSRKLTDGAAKKMIYKLIREDDKLRVLLNTLFK